MRLLGLDGCKSGWVVAESDDQLSALTLYTITQVSTLIDELQDQQAIVAIDIPIGLMKDGPRHCDQAARALLGSPRNNSVSSAPCRATLNAATYLEACELNLAARGKKISRQCFGILPKIYEVDRVLTPERQGWIREAHPEVTFAMLGGRQRGLIHAKKARSPLGDYVGEVERLALLPSLLSHINLPAELQRLRQSARVARDDLVDALACLTTAHRIHSNSAHILPAAATQLDDRGLRMEIVA